MTLSSNPRTGGKRIGFERLKIVVALPFSGS